ncbi:MAG: TonB-dependent receptor plug domain-containing protein [Neisseriaceae bacterium]|nr:MAG: TonB-dependent receptor plug domain-containing protein [Neisseriaceae bacterium]
MQLNRIVMILSTLFISSLNSIIFASHSDENDGADDQKNNSVQEVIKNDLDKAASVFKLPTIEVLGYGFKEKLNTISGSVDVYTQDDILRTQSKNLNELIKNTPGFQSMSFAMVDYMIIRGTGSMYDVKGKSHSVFLNGIPLPSTESKNLLLTDDISAVEVMKGPQHILYGSQSRSGAISVYTKRPSQTKGVIALGFGNDNIRNISWNQSVKINDYVSLSLGIDRLHDGGFVKNLTTGQKRGGFTANNYDIRLFLKPSTKTFLDFYFNNQKINAKKPVMTHFGRNLQPLTYYFSSFDTAQTPMLEGSKLNFWEQRNDYGGDTQRRTRSFSTSLEHYFNDNMSLKYIYSNSKYNETGNIDIDNTDVDFIKKIGLLHVTHDYKAYSSYQDLRLTGEYDLFKWIFGISKTIDYNRRLAAGNPFGITARGMRMGDTVKGKAVYTQWKIIPSQYIDFILGFRRQVDKVTPEFYSFSDNDLVNTVYDKWIDPFLTNVIKGGTLPSVYSSAANLWSGTLTLHFTPKISLYTTASKGYVSGGYQSFITNNLIRPERGISREIGFKSQLFDDRLFLVGAIYKNKYRNYQFFNFLKYSLENIPNFESKGYEIASYFILHPNVTIGLTHSKVDPRIKDYQMQDSFGFVKAGFYDAYSDLTTFRNKTIPWIPKSNSHLDLIINGKIQSTDVIWTTTVSRRGKMYIDFGNKLALKPMHTLDSSVVFKKKKHDIVVWAKNLTNKKYFSNAVSSGVNLGTYGRSRSFGITYKVTI